MSSVFIETYSAESAAQKEKKKNKRRWEDVTSPAQAIRIEEYNPGHYKENPNNT